jgi:hypothetical protein
MELPATGQRSRQCDKFDNEGRQANMTPQADQKETYVKQLPDDIYASFQKAGTNPVLVIVFNQDGSDVAFTPAGILKDFKPPSSADPSKLKAPHFTLQHYEDSMFGNPTCQCWKCTLVGCGWVPCPCP